MGRKNKVSPAEAVVADDVSPTPAVAPQIPAEEKRDESDSNNNSNKNSSSGSHGAGHDLSRSRIFFMSFFVAGGQDSFFVISFFL